MHFFFTKIFSIKVQTFLVLISTPNKYLHKLCGNLVIGFNEKKNLGARSYITEHRAINYLMFKHQAYSFMRHFPVYLFLHLVFPPFVSMAEFEKHSHQMKVMPTKLERKTR